MPLFQAGRFQTLSVFNRDAHLDVIRSRYLRNIMSNHWNKAVSVRIGTGISDTIHGPVEAFEALNNRWPAEHGPRYDKAKERCSMAVGGTLSAEIA